MKTKIFLALAAAVTLLALTPTLTRAAIFDAADILKPGSHSIGILTEVILSNPSSEGIELRAKRGINDMVNLEGIFGTGSDNRRLRFGGQSTITLFPDADGQPGISLYVSTLYLKRESYGSLLLSGGPMIQEMVDGMHGLPINLYLAAPWTIELHKGNYNTSFQLAFGANYEISDQRNWFANTEAGLSLSRSESYVAVGVGMRFGSTAFDMQKEKKHKRKNGKNRNDDENTDDEEELRSEDFLKK